MEFRVQEKKKKTALILYGLGNVMESNMQEKKKRAAFAPVVVTNTAI